jgi:hypothetical protein
MLSGLMSLWSVSGTDQPTRQASSNQCKICVGMARSDNENRMPAHRWMKPRLWTASIARIHSAI